MAKITLNINKNDLAELLRKGTALEKELLSDSGSVYSFLLEVSNGYKMAVLSGIGKTTTGTLTLKEFLNSVRSVNWKENAPATLKHKAKMGWALTVWKASGETERAVQVYRAKSGNTISMFSGIDGTKNPEEYAKALRTEFGGTSNPGGHSFDGRALFTLLNVILTDPASIDVISSQITRAIDEAIAKIGWGS